MSIIKYKSNDDVDIQKLRELSYIDMYKCVNACWYYLDNLASNVWSENEAKNILAECYIENNDIEDALSVLCEVLVADRYNFDALKLIINGCLDTLDMQERKTIGTLAILAYEKISIEYARKGENVPIEMAILLAVDDIGGGLFEEDVITVVDRERDVLNVSREIAHISRMYGYSKALAILNANYAGIADLPSFIALKARYYYLCGNYVAAADLIKTIDDNPYDTFCAVLSLRSACVNYYGNLDINAGNSEIELLQMETAIDRLMNSVCESIDVFMYALDTLFFAKEYEKAIELIECSEFTANSKVLMFLAAAKSNIGEEGEAIITFKLAHNIYRKYCDAGLNYSENELFIPHDGEFVAEDINILNRDVSAEIDDVIEDALKETVIEELTEVLAIAISHAYAVSDLDKLSILVCDKMSDNAIKDNADFFKRQTYNYKLPNRIRADILYRIMLAYPKKYVTCGFGRVVHFTKYLTDAKLLANDFRFKTYLYALSRKYVFHDTNYSYEYDVLFKRFEILFPSNLKVDRKNYKLAALFASKICFYYKPMYTDEMLCSEFGIDYDYFQSQFDEFMCVNEKIVNDQEALCSKEFGSYDIIGKYRKKSPEELYLTQADIENLKNHPKVRLYDFAAYKSDGTDKK